MADVQSGKWNFILDFHCRVSSSSGSDVINMIKTGDSSWKCLSFTELEMDLKFIIDHAFHHLSGDLECSQRWWAGKTLSSLSNSIEHFNHIWFSRSALEAFILCADLTRSRHLSIVACDLVDTFFGHVESILLWFVGTGSNATNFHKDWVSFIILVQKTIERTDA